MQRNVRKDLTVKLNAWLRREVNRLEGEIRHHSVFTSKTRATRDQITDLRTKIVIHAYLKQQLLDRAASGQYEQLDTREQGVAA